MLSVLRVLNSSADVIDMSAKIASINCGCDAGIYSGRLTSS